MVDRFSEVLLASDVSFRRLHRGVAKQNLKRFDFATTCVAKAGAATAKIVRCTIDNGLAHRLTASQTDVGGHASFLSRSVFENSSECFALVYSRTTEPDVHKTLAPGRHGYRSQPFVFANQADNDPVALPQSKLIQPQAHEFRAPQSTSEQQSEHCKVSKLT